MPTTTDHIDLTLAMEPTMSLIDEIESGLDVHAPEVFQALRESVANLVFFVAQQRRSTVHQ